jgi:UDP-N-acetylmuramoylalanine-D-glutamate ligase
MFDVLYQLAISGNIPAPLLDLFSSFENYLSERQLVLESVEKGRISIVYPIKDSYATSLLQRTDQVRSFFDLGSQSRLRVSKRRASVQHPRTCVSAKI